MEESWKVFWFSNNFMYIVIFGIIFFSFDIISQNLNRSNSNIVLLRVWSRRISHHSKTSLNPRHRTRPKSWFILPFRGCGWGRWGHQIFRHAAWGRYWPQVYVASSVQVTFLKIFVLKTLNQLDLFSLLQKTINQIDFENKVMFDFKRDKCRLDEFQ